MAGYGDDAGFSAWLTANGYDLPVGVDVPSVPVLRQRGSVYIDGLYGSRFCGSPVGGYTQERAWPRSNARLGCSSIPDDIVPIAIINASYAAALFEAENPGVLSVVVTPGEAIKREKISVIETEYFGGGGALESATPILGMVDGLLAPFLCVEVAQPLGIYAVG